MDLMGVSRIAIGDDLYLWRHPHGGDRCLISAHGSFTGFDGYFRPSDINPAVRLYFYSEHGVDLNDPGINVLDGNHRSVNVPTQGDNVPNYRLSKYQGHSGERGETYESVRDKINRDVYFEETINEVPEDERGTYMRMRDIMVRAHIVTIRRRKGISLFSTVTLKNLVARVYNYPLDGTRITQFHCSFCRGNYFNPRSKSQDAPLAPDRVN